LLEAAHSARLEEAAAAGEQLESLQSQMNEVDAELTDKKFQLDSEITRAVEAERQVEVLEMQVRTQVRAAEAAVQAAADEKGRKDAELSALRAARAEMEGQLASLQQEHASLQQEHASLQQEHALLQQERASLQQTVDKLQQSVNELQQSVNELHLRHGETSALCKMTEDELAQAKHDRDAAATAAQTLAEEEKAKATVLGLSLEQYKDQLAAKDAEVFLFELAVYVHVYVCLYVCMYVYMSVYMCICISLSLSTYTYIYIFIYIYIYIYIYV